MSLHTYQSLLSRYTATSVSFDKQLRFLSTVRLLLFISFLFTGYKAVQVQQTLFIVLSVTSLLAFLVILKVYDKIEKQLLLVKNLVRINKNEIDFLNGKTTIYDAGTQYIDPHHSYSYDLDLFGEGGLFAYINRTATSYGKEKLAHLLLHPAASTIVERQDAIGELKEKLDFRQSVHANGLTDTAKENEIAQLNAWIKEPAIFKNKKYYYALLLFPAITVGLLLFYCIDDKPQILNLFYTFFVFNLIILGYFAKKIKQQLSISSSVSKVLEQFSQQVSKIEEEKFQSKLLLTIQQQLKTSDGNCSRSIKKLSSLFGYLETILNLVLTPLLNGLFLFHIHILYRLDKWKEQNGSEIVNWLKLLGETEALNSLANLAFNNPGFCRPELKPVQTLVAEEMGHPLIRQEKRIANSISFAEDKFIILTGSNMSGKSTFLRTLGINLVLAKAGTVVCAKQFSFYPYELHISMRISDSLQDSESFFYAELKRLQQIIRFLENGQTAFVILDEILRGTNSNDKHSGTIGLIRKLASSKATGIIATHDLTVAKMITEYPGYINNKCFESQIVNEELLFDFKLKDGVCTTLSASFLMNKMGIIHHS